MKRQQIRTLTALAVSCTAALGSEVSNHIVYDTQDGFVAIERIGLQAASPEMRERIESSFEAEGKIRTVPTRSYARKFRPNDPSGRSLTSPSLDLPFAKLKKVKLDLEFAALEHPEPPNKTIASQRSTSDEDLSAALPKLGAEIHHSEGDTTFPVTGVAPLDPFAWGGAFLYTYITGGANTRDICGPNNDGFNRRLLTTYKRNLDVSIPFIGDGFELFGNGIALDVDLEARLSYSSQTWVHRISSKRQPWKYTKQADEIGNGWLSYASDIAVGKGGQFGGRRMIQSLRLWSPGLRRAVSQITWTPGVGAIVGGKVSFQGGGARKFARFNAHRRVGSIETNNTSTIGGGFWAEITPWFLKVGFWSGFEYKGVANRTIYHDRDWFCEDSRMMRKRGGNINAVNFFARGSVSGRIGPIVYNRTPINYSRPIYKSKYGSSRYEYVYPKDSRAARLMDWRM